MPVVLLPLALGLEVTGRVPTFWLLYGRGCYIAWKFLLNQTPGRPSVGASVVLPIAWSHGPNIAKVSSALNIPQHDAGNHFDLYYTKIKIRGKLHRQPYSA